MVCSGFTHVRIHASTQLRLNASETRFPAKHKSGESESQLLNKNKQVLSLPQWLFYTLREISRFLGMFWPLCSAAHALQTTTERDLHGAANRDLNSSWSQTYTSMLSFGKPTYYLSEIGLQERSRPKGKSWRRAEEQCTDMNDKLCPQMIQGMRGLLRGVLW